MSRGIDRVGSIARRGGGVLLSLALGLGIDALIFRSNLVPAGHPLQSVRLMASLVVLLGAWLAIRRPPQPPREDAPRRLVRVAWFVRVVGAIAFAQLVQTADTSFVAPMSTALLYGGGSESFLTLIALKGTWFVVALLVLPLRAGLVAQRALASGDPAPLRRLLLPTAAICALTCLTLLFDNPWRYAEYHHEPVELGLLSMRLNPISFVVHSYEARVPMAIAELVLALLLVAGWLHLRRLDAMPAIPEALASADTDDAERFLSDVD